jgi:hypothetical protein
MSFFPFLFIPAFIAMFFLASYTISKKGWSDLQERFRYDGDFQGENIGLISASINGMNYQNCLILKFDQEGFYLRPLLIFRIFQKPVFIPWKEVKHVRDKNFIVGSTKELVIGEPAIVLMQMRASTFQRMESSVFFDAPYKKTSHPVT